MLKSGNPKIESKNKEDGDNPEITPKCYWDGHEVTPEIYELIEIYRNFEITFSVKDGKIILKEPFDVDKELLGWDYSGSVDDAMSV
jgi:hypothetical protein